ncbi:uncharacterized protein LOC108046417 isoform X2 [Drosophila rhopaloa]|uniref:Uncharacterized protein LOC108046417 isoform X2 n=1 Tax=Drosophila rhopaloa TaxID=1041015 RepID=A0A6P4F843_DRORH|nr:uncharacterized protein LOC108046417 isoform X2 [Drosophila rhopaloa]
MPNTERPRARPKHRNRSRIRARAATPEDVLENHLQQLFEEQELLHNLLISHRPGIKSQLEDLGGESNYEFDTQDEDGDDGMVEPLQVPNLKVEQSKEVIEEDQQEFNDKPDPVILAEDVVDFSSSPELPKIPSLPPRMYPYPMNHRSSCIPLPFLVGKCTPPKVNGQGFDPPFMYPEFIAKNQESRVKYIFTLVDSLVVQMERFLKISEHLRGEGAPKKRSTGTVPKSRPPSQFKIDQVGHAKYTITVNPRFKEPKQHNQSKNKLLAKSREQSFHQLPVIHPEPELDLDYEFGMEHIEKFRANKVRDESRGGTGIGKDKKEPTCNTGAVKKEVVKKRDPRPSGPHEFLDGFPECSFQGVRKSTKAIKKQAKWLNNGGDTLRPSTPITRPCTPDDNIPCTSNQAKNKIPTSRFSSKEEFFDTNCDFLIYKDSHPSAKTKARGAAEELADNKAPPTENNQSAEKPTLQRGIKREMTLTEIRRLGPELTDYQWDIIYFMREYRKDKKWEEKQRKAGKVPGKRPETFMKLKKRNLAREELARKYSYVPIKRVKKRPKYYKAFKRYKEFLKAEREYKKIQQARNPMLYPAKKMSKKEYRLRMQKLLNIRPRKIMKPRRMPKTKIRNQPVGEMPKSYEVTKRNEPIDRGQRLKNLLMDGERLRKQERLYHLVLPEDPLKAVYLPVLERRESFKSCLQCTSIQIMENDPESDFQSARSHHSTTTEFNSVMSKIPSGGSLSCRSSYSTCSAPPSRASSNATLCHDANQPSDTFHSCMDIPGRSIRKLLRIKKGTEKRGNKKLGMDLGAMGDLPRTKDKNKRRKPAKDIAQEDLHEPVVRYIPLKGDFRCYFELDGVSLQIIQWVARMRFRKGPIDGQKRICKYLAHFYWERLLRDGLFFHWFVNEGFFPAHYLTKERTAEELETLTNSQLDDEIVKYIDSVNTPDGERILFTFKMAHVMVVSYFRVLYYRATSERRPPEERFLLRCRFATSMVELYQQERGRQLLKGGINCLKLLHWALRHEGRVNQVYDEPVSNAEERAGINTCLVMRTPNLESLKEFYQRRVVPRPDALAINPMASRIRRYPNKDRARPADFLCPIQGCLSGLNSQILMAHFLSDHCRRMEELWLTDRMVLLFYPDCYPPMQIYCICVLALLGRMPCNMVPQPRLVLNQELPSKLLYFAEHIPCFLMFAQVAMESVEASVGRKLSPVKTKHGKDPLVPHDKDHATMYIFWLATADHDYPNVACRVYIYCQDRSVKGRSLLDFMKMSEFKGVPDMVTNYPKSYLAIDYPTMVSLTKDFNELIFIEVRYVNKLVDDPEDSGDEVFDV